jgi:hypothetical protein
MNYAEKYWLTEEAEELLPRANKKRRAFLDKIEETGLYERILRNLSLYHGITTDDPTTLEDGIQLAGEEGEAVAVNLNVFRASLSLLKTYITSARVEWDTLADSADADAITATKRGNDILDGLMLDSTNGLEAGLSQSVEDALVLASGWVWNLWDDNLGDVVGVDPFTGEEHKSGAYRHLNPCFTDVAYDYTVRDPKESRWFLVRRQENRWDVMAEFPEEEYPGVAEAVRRAGGRDENYTRFDFTFDSREDDCAGDFLWVSYLYVKPSPAIPQGRFVRFIGEDIVLEDLDHLPDGHIPVHRIVPAQFLLTPFGFTPGFSAQAPQELLNGVASTIATNINALGENKIWKKPGDPINRPQLDPGIRLIECETKPEGIDLLKLSPELFKAVEMYLSFNERLIGTNAAAHGQPEGKDVSGSALAFTEQRVQQAASDLVRAYDILLADVGTSILQGYQKRLLWRGKAGAGTRAQSFTPEDLEGIERVSVVRGNPLLRTLGGRVQVGQILMERGGLDSAGFLELTQTGSIDKLIESRDNQDELINHENDAFLRGEDSHIALPTDDHIQHIKRHAAVLVNPAARKDPQVNQRGYAAMLQHKQMMADPEVQTWMVLLYGYPPIQAPAPAAGPGVAPGQPQPGGGGKALPAGRPKPKALPAPKAPQQTGPRLIGAPEGTNQALETAGAA